MFLFNQLKMKISFKAKNCLHSIYVNVTQELEVSLNLVEWYLYNIEKKIYDTFYFSS